MMISLREAACAAIWHAGDRVRLNVRSRKSLRDTIRNIPESDCVFGHKRTLGLDPRGAATGCSEQFLWPAWWQLSFAPVIECSVESVKAFRPQPGKSMAFDSIRDKNLQKTAIYEIYQRSESNESDTGHLSFAVGHCFSASD